MSLKNDKDLIEIMKGVSTTSGWDVLVSYEEDKLNRFLEKMYREKKIAADININTTYSDPISGRDYRLQCIMHIGAPVIQFDSTLQRQCILKMPIIEATYQFDDGPKKPIQGNKYQIKASVPLAVVKGDTNLVKEDKHIIFDGSIAEYHIVLHFENKETMFEIEPDPTGPDSALQTIFTNLKNWFVTNTKAIDYALASVNNKVEEKGVLQPKSFVFTTTRDEDNKVGILSIYVQTGDNAGEANPKFSPRGKSILPITSKHDATIILSHDLIVKSFLIPVITNKNFTVSSDCATEGISLKILSHKKLLEVFDSRGWDSEYQFGNIDMDLKYSMDIKNNSIQILLNETAVVYWNYYDPRSPTNPDNGIIDVKVKLDKTYPLGSTDQIIKSNLSTINANDYTIDPVARKPAWYQSFFTSMVDYVPDPFYKLKIVIPSINFELGSINFFAVTNVLTPGRNVIAVDKTDGVHVPYDLLITGNIISASISRYLISRNHLNYLDPDLSTYQSPVMAMAMIDELLRSQPILGQLIKAMITGNDSNVTKAITDNGYKVDLSTADQLETAVKGLLHSDESDIRIWEGLYKFTKPNSLVNKELTVSPQNGRVTFDNRNIEVSLISSDHITWEDGGKAFDLTFKDSYGPDGKMKPFTFSGTVITPNQKPEQPPIKEVLEGEQYIAPPEDEYWTSNPAVTTISFILGALGIGVVGIIGMIIKKCKGKPVSDEMIEMKKISDGFEKFAGNQADRQSDPAELDWSTYRDDLKKNIDVRIISEIQGKSDDDIKESNIPNLLDNMRKGITQAAIEQLKSDVTSEIEPKIRDALDLFEPFIDINKVISEVVDKITADKVSALESTSYVDSCISAKIYQERNKRLEQEIGAKQTEIERLSGDIQSSKDEKTRRESELRKIEDDIRKEQDEEKRKTLEGKRKNLDKEINDIERAIKDKEDEQKDRREKSDSAEIEKKNNEEKRKEDEGRAEERGKEIFKP